MSCELVETPWEPPAELVARTVHMHVHDVHDKVDHLPLRPDSHRVAEYIGMAGRNGVLQSITLEYGYPEPVEEHLIQTVQLVTSWATGEEEVELVAEV